MFLSVPGRSEKTGSAEVATEENLASTSSTADAIKAKLRKAAKLKDKLKRNEDKMPKDANKIKGKEVRQSDNSKEIDNCKKKYNSQSSILEDTKFPEKSQSKKEEKTKEPTINKNLEDDIIYIDEDVKENILEKTTIVSNEIEDISDTGKISELSCDHRDSVMFQEIYSDQWWDASNQVLETNLPKRNTPPISSLPADEEKSSPINKDTNLCIKETDYGSCALSTFYDATEFHKSTTPSPSHLSRDYEAIDRYEEITHSKPDVVESVPLILDKDETKKQSDQSSSMKAREWVKSFNEVANKKANQIVTDHVADLKRISRCYSETELGESAGLWAHKDEICLKGRTLKAHNSLTCDDQITELKSQDERTNLARRESLKKVFGVKSRMGFGSIVDVNRDVQRQTDLCLSFSPAILASATHERVLTAIDSLDDDCILVSPLHPEKPDQRISPRKEVSSATATAPLPSQADVTVSGSKKISSNVGQCEHIATDIIQSTKDTSRNEDTSEINRILDILEGRVELPTNIFSDTQIKTKVYTEKKIESDDEIEKQLSEPERIDTLLHTDEVESVSQWNGSFVEDDSSPRDISSEEDLNSTRCEEKKPNKKSGATKFSKSIKSFAGSLFTDSNKQKTGSNHNEENAKGDKKKFKFSVKDKIVSKLTSAKGSTPPRAVDSTKENLCVPTPKIVITASSFDQPHPDLSNNYEIELGPQPHAQELEKQQFTEGEDVKDISLETVESGTLVNSEVDTNVIVDQQLPDFAKLSEETEMKDCLPDDDAATTYCFESIWGTEDDECKFSEDDRLDDENATMYFSFRTAGERSKSNSFSADEEDISLLRKCGIIQTDEEEGIMRKLAVGDHQKALKDSSSSSNPNDVGPEKVPDVGSRAEPIESGIPPIACDVVCNKTTKNDVEICSANDELNDYNQFVTEEFYNQCDGSSIADDISKLNTENSEKNENPTLNLPESEAPVVPKPCPRFKKNKGGYLTQSEVVDEPKGKSVHESVDDSSQICAHSVTGVGGCTEEKALQGELKSKNNAGSLTDAVCDPDTGEHIYCEIGDTAKLSNAPVPMPRGKKGKKELSNIADTTYAVTMQSTPQSIYDVSPNSDQSSQKSIPDWLQNRGPIPNPRKCKQASMHCLPTTPRDRNSSSSKTDHQPPSHITLKGSDPMAWDGEEFYCGKSASIAYGVSSQSGAPIIGAQEEVVHSALPPPPTKHQPQPPSGGGGARSQPPTKHQPQPSSGGGSARSQQSATVRPVSLTEADLSSRKTKQDFEIREDTAEAGYPAKDGTEMLPDVRGINTFCDDTEIYNQELRPARRKKKGNPVLQNIRENADVSSAKEGAKEGASVTVYWEPFFL